MTAGVEAGDTSEGLALVGPLPARARLAPETVEVPAGEPAPAAVEGPQPRGKRKEWALHLAPAFDYFGLFGDYAGYGGGFRFAGHRNLRVGGFYIGGGPVMHYTYLGDSTGDAVHLFTVGPDMLIGGGTDKFTAYGHLTFGLGVVSAADGATDARITTVGARAAAGVGAYGYVTPKISVGALVDVGWAFALWLNPMLTVNFHFGDA